MYTENQKKTKTIFLLSKIQNSKVSYTLPDYWYKGLADSFEDLVSILINQGLLAYSDLQENLDNTTLPDLKKVLKDCGLSVSGKKTILIDRALNNIQHDTLWQFSLKNARYKLTLAGLNLLNDFQAQVDNMQDQLFNWIVEGNYEQAIMAYSNYQESVQLPDNGLPIPINPIETIKKVSSWDYSDLDNSQEFKQIFIAAFALHELCGTRITLTLDKYTQEKFSCPALINDIKKYKICYYEGDFVDPDDAIKVYMQTKTMGNAIDALTNLKNAGASTVQILSAMDDAMCSACKKNVNKKFPLSEIEKIPKLPLHYGCRCCYVTGDL